MQISNNTVVSVHYKLVVDGEMIDQSTDQPLTYLHGHHAMIPGFETNLEGKIAGDEYDFTILPKDGYGERDENAVSELDAEIFKVDGKISDQVYVGAQLRLTDSEGHPIIGFVLSIGDTKVKMDFNHMLAGKTLHFSGNVHEVRQALPEEIQHGHVHGPDGHHH